MNEAKRKKEEDIEGRIKKVKKGYRVRLREEKEKKEIKRLIKKLKEE